MQKPLKITSRSSTITNAFVQAILPFNTPDPDERKRILDHFSQSADAMRCIYCGDRATDWDHLEPLVAHKRPTGRTSGLGNVVPACSRCNQSKSGQSWRAWVAGPAPNSPRTRGVEGLDERIAAIEAFQRDFAHIGFRSRKRLVTLSGQNTGASMMRYKP